MMLRLSCILFTLGLWSLSAQAQVITQISTLWDDRVDQWVIYTDNEDLEGLIELRWPLREDLSEWKYELDELSGIIKQTWKGNPNSWEVIPYDGPRIIAKTIWQNDFSEWKITQGNKIYRFKSKYPSQRFEWELSKGKQDEFYIYMINEADPRDWSVEDYIEDGSLDLSIAMSFVAIYNSLPRN